jgi:penicillin-binding protein-related factor A (putative recombinase)
VTPARSQIAGQSLEDVLNFAHKLYANRGQTWVRHNEIRGRFRSRGGGQAEFTPSPAKGAPDYYGCVDGRMIAFDAKSHGSDDAWILPTDRLHQFWRLADIAAAGGICWFAIEHRPSQLLYLLRIRAVQSIGDHQFSGDRPQLKFPPPPDVLTVPDAGGWYDWLSVVRAHWLTSDHAAADAEVAITLVEFVVKATVMKWLRHTDLCGVHLISKDNRCTCGLSAQLEKLEVREVTA